MKTKHNNSPTVNDDSPENINLENKLLYEKLKQEHLEEGGKYPESFAITELIKDAIIQHTYKIYYGGGYEHRTEKRIKKLDVVVWFNFGGDAFFQLCMDNSEGDSCDLWNSNSECTFEKKVF